MGFRRSFLPGFSEGAGGISLLLNQPIRATVTVNPHNMVMPLSSVTIQPPIRVPSKIETKVPIPT